MSPLFFIETLSSNGIDFFCGVPDSLLKSFCACLQDHIPGKNHIIAANEGGAIALAAGYHLATGKTGCVYMQNSGEGNAVNPLASLTDKEVYRIPVLLLIGWRGRPGLHDEPQHIKQGKITTGLLNLLGIDYTVLSKNELEAQKQIIQAITQMRATGEAYALVIEKDTFDTCLPQCQNQECFELSREEAIQSIAGLIGDHDVIVSSTGMISRELFEYRAHLNIGHERDFLTVGSMGHASQIALGIALAQPDRRVFCFDGDGAVLMHMGSLPVIAQNAPQNYIHVVFNNGAHDSVGGQPTVGLEIDLPAVAKACGYQICCSIDKRSDLLSLVPDLLSNHKGPVFLEVKVRKGNRKDLGRPTVSPIQNKEALMQFLKAD